MASHSSTLAWKIPWTEGPGRLQSMGLQRAKHDSTHAHTHASTNKSFNVKFRLSCLEHKGMCGKSPQRRSFQWILKKSMELLPTFKKQN